MKYLLPVVLVFFMFQKGRTQEIDSMLAVYAEQLPEQKVHVHFDKDIYRAGETVWFKAYIFAGFLPAINSKHFYAELIDNSGNILQRKIFPVVESSSAGHFDLPPTIAGGTTYRFRGYTTWMMNFDTAFIYRKDLVITDRNGEISKNRSIPVIKETKFDIFPEGGDLVNDIESVVAFKATDNFGVPVDVSGKIYDSKQQVVTEFKSVHDGMGTFTITPVANESYTARWSVAGGAETSTPLPAAKNEGIVLQIKNMPGQKVFSIKRSANSSEVYHKLRVVAQLGQQLIYKARVPLTNLVNGGAIPTKDFPAGIVTITVFTDDWKPLVERIVMINNGNHELGMSLKILGKNLAKRGKNAFEITLPDSNLTNLSVSVVDVGLVSNKHDENIVSRLLMTGDLKGYVHQPGYYFSGTADSVQQHVDLVMLTHGWRRYNWQNLVAGKMPALKFKTEPNLSLVAKVYGVTSYTPLPNDEQIAAIIETKDSTRMVFNLPKTGKDVFSINDVVFYDTAKVYYQFMKNRGMSNTFSVTFDNGLYKGHKKIKPDTLPNAAEIVNAMLLARNKDIAGEVIKYESKLSSTVHQLGPVIVKTRQKSKAQELDEMYANGLFRGQDAYTFDIANDPASMGAMNIFTYLQGRVAGLQVNNPMGTPSIVWRGSQTSLFLNEMPVDAEMLGSVNVRDIAYVKVFRPPFFGAMGGGAGGAIAIYTRKGGESNNAPLPGVGLARNIIVGYSPSKEFYSPNYDAKEQLDNVETDYRTTLYWNPFVFMDHERQNVKVEFFNNDFSKGYKIVVEGVNDVGKMIRIEKVVE